MAEGHDHLTYESWTSMMARCFNRKAKNYAKYGGRGVTVCACLAESPKNLKDLLGPRPAEMNHGGKAREYTLDRFPEANGNYTCGRCAECKHKGWSRNVRWATKEEQNKNRPAFNKPITAFGRTMLFAEWAAETGIEKTTLWQRLFNSSLSVEEALTRAYRGKRYNPATRTLEECKGNFIGVSYAYAKSVVKGKLYSYEYWSADLTVGKKKVFTKRFPYTEQGWRQAAKAFNEQYLKYHPGAEIPNPDWETRPYPEAKKRAVPS